MKYSENIIEVAKLKPDFMGFIFYSESKRFVGENFKMPKIDATIKKVGVFVNQEIDSILTKIALHQLEFVQLHGNESVEYAKKLSESVKIIKAFGVDENFNFSHVDEYNDYCDYYLFDTKTKDFGGSGKKFDWQLLNNYSGKKPFFLSGGINSTETGNLNPFAIDVNSQFEISAGLKDIEKLKLINRKVR